MSILCIMSGYQMVFRLVKSWLNASWVQIEILELSWMVFMTKIKSCGVLWRQILANWHRRFRSWLCKNALLRLGLWSSRRLRFLRSYPNTSQSVRISSSSGSIDWQGLRCLHLGKAAWSPYLNAVPIEPVGRPLGSDNGDIWYYSIFFVLKEILFWHC